MDICRVSTLKQAAEGESLDVQRRQIEGYALMQGMTVDQKYQVRLGGKLHNFSVLSALAEIAYAPSGENET